MCYLLLQKRKECRKFQHAIPTYIEQLAEMFHGIVVYGSSSCIPGDVHRVYEEQEEDGDGEDLLNSSTPSSRGKRSFTSTSRSPPKKRKSPVVKMFNGLISEMQLSRNADTDVFNQLKTIQENKSLQAIDQFNSCLDLPENLELTRSQMSTLRQPNYSRMSTTELFSIALILQHKG